MTHLLNSCLTCTCNNTTMLPPTITPLVPFTYITNHESHQMTFPISQLRRMREEVKPDLSWMPRKLYSMGWRSTVWHQGYFGVRSQTRKVCNRVSRIWSIFQSLNRIRLNILFMLLVPGTFTAASQSFLAPHWVHAAVHFEKREKQGQ